MLLTTLFVFMFHYVTSLDEIHGRWGPGHADGLFNHPPSAAEPLASGKDRQQLELFSWRIPWVILWYSTS